MGNGLHIRLRTSKILRRTRLRDPAVRRAGRIAGLPGIGSNRGSTTRLGSAGSHSTVALFEGRKRLVVVVEPDVHEGQVIGRNESPLRHLAQAW
jgi:hypothetical protein